MANFHERKLGFSRYAKDGTKMHYYDIVVDTAADIPNPADHPEWEIGSELVVLENGGSKYRLSNAREWVSVNFNSGGGGDSAKLQEELDKAKATLDSVIDKTVTSVKSNATKVGKYGFSRCSVMTEVVFPLVTSIGDNAFEYCSALSKADFYIATEVGGYAFSNCSSLKALILRSQEMCRSTAYSGIAVAPGSPLNGGDGYIYVPKSIIEEYRTSSGWSAHKNNFRALEDYTVDGTVTGELDESKI